MDMTDIISSVFVCVRHENCFLQFVLKVKRTDVFLQAVGVKLVREQPTSVEKFTGSCRAKLYFTPLL
jgi:hypothetical protein